ncbi:unnamed protein product [Sphagnum balticum]
MEVVLSSSSSSSRAKLFFLGSDWIQSLGDFGLPNKTTKKLLSPPRRVLCAVVLESQVPGSRNWSTLLLLRSNNIASDGLGLRPISSVAKEGGKKDKGAAAAAAEEVVEAAGREQGQGGDDDTEVSASVSDKGGASCHAQQLQEKRSH